MLPVCAHRNRYACLESNSTTEKRNTCSLEVYCVVGRNRSGKSTLIKVNNSFFPQRKIWRAIHSFACALRCLPADECRAKQLLLKLERASADPSDTDISVDGVNFRSLPRSRFPTHSTLARASEEGVVIAPANASTRVHKLTQVAPPGIVREAEAFYIPRHNQG